MRARHESLALASRDPDYRRDQQLAELIARMILSMREHNIRSIVRDQFHNAVWFLLLRLSMAGFDMQEYCLFRDIVSGRFQKIDQILTEYCGLLLHQRIEARGPDYYIDDVSKRIEQKLIDPSYFEDYQVTDIDRAVRFAVAAYHAKCVPEEVLKRAGLN